ncbi:MAG: DNA cytosine methyltransferase [Patescibacteria group bacterium]|jgi:hypothetical protein
MRIIVGCEFSQVVTMAFRERGHEAFSCDILPCEGGRPEWHYQEDIFNVLKREQFDMGIFHPPCTYLSYAGIAHWNKPGRLEKRLVALNFFANLWLSPIDKICIENPKGCASPTIAKYTQEIQPYYFGDDDLKTTWLWLKNLPPLVHTENDTLFETRTHVDRPKPFSIDNTPRQKKRYFADGKNRDQHERSKTFIGIARAMVDQWGAL